MMVNNEEAIVRTVILNLRSEYIGSGSEYQLDPDPLGPNRIPPNWGRAWYGIGAFRGAATDQKVTGKANEFPPTFG